MGGQILKLRSEELIEQGITQGREEGDLKRVMKTASNMLQAGEAIDKIAGFLELPAETIRSWAKEAGLSV